MLVRTKGVEALVVTALPKVNKVAVEGVNIVKGASQIAENPQGAIVEKEAPCQVQVLDKNGVAGRVGYKFVDGKKVRYNKKIRRSA